MDFINRKEEMQRLMRIYKRSEPGLVVIWGRRRLGLLNLQS